MAIDPERKEKLLQIREKLFDVYLEEADPENWTTEESAREEAQRAMEQEEITAKDAAKLMANWKGERYWEKKNANQTMTMLLAMERFMEGNVAAAGDDPDDAKAQAKEARRLEAEARKRLARTRPNLRAVTGGKK